MAVTKAADVVNVGNTATQIVAANADRRALVIKVQFGEVWLGNDNTVTADGGYWMAQGDTYEDSIPTTDAYYAISRGGRNAKVSYMEATDA